MLVDWMATKQRRTRRMKLCGKVSILAGLCPAVYCGWRCWCVLGCAEEVLTNGGNLNEKTQRAFGVQVGGKIDDTFSVEMSEQVQ